MKTISIDETIYSLVNNYPEIKDVLFSLGFTQLDNPVMFNSVAKVMTLRKALRVQNVSILDLRESLLKLGYIIKEEDYNEWIN